MSPNESLGNRFGFSHSIWRAADFSEGDLGLGVVQCKTEEVVNFFFPRKRKDRSGIADYKVGEQVRGSSAGNKN